MREGDTEQSPSSMKTELIKTELLHWKTHPLHKQQLDLVYLYNSPQPCSLKLDLNILSLVTNWETQKQEEEEVDGRGVQQQTVLCLLCVPGFDVACPLRAAVGLLWGRSCWWSFCFWHLWEKNKKAVAAGHCITGEVSEVVEDRGHGVGAWNQRAKLEDMGWSGKKNTGKTTNLWPLFQEIFDLESKSWQHEQ